MARKRVRELEKMVSRLTDNFEVSTTRGSHYRVTVRGPGGQLSVITSSTGSDHREDRNFMAQAARAVLAVSLPAEPDYRAIPDAVSKKVAARKRAGKGERK